MAIFFRSMFLSACILGLFGFNMAYAHEFLLKPDVATGIEVNQDVQFQVQEAHTFMKSDEMDKIVNVNVYIQQGASSTKLNLAGNEELKALIGKLKLAESAPALLVGHRLPEVWSETTEGVLIGNRDELKAKGKKVRSVGKYEKFAKTLLNPSAEDSSYKEAVGQYIEIILLNNPATLKVGDEMQVQVLVNKTPTKGIVSVTYDGYSEEQKYLTEIESDDQGIAKFNIEKAGLWLVRSEYTRKFDKKQVRETGINTHNYRATYVFPIVDGVSSK